MCEKCWNEFSCKWLYSCRSALFLYPHEMMCSRQQCISPDKAVLSLIRICRTFFPMLLSGHLPRAADRHSPLKSQHVFQQVYNFWVVWSSSQSVCGSHSTTLHWTKSLSLSSLSLICVFSVMLRCWQTDCLFVSPYWFSGFAWAANSVSASHKAHLTTDERMSRFYILIT